VGGYGRMHHKEVINEKIKKICESCRDL
jgi:hypothetical protein